MARHKSYRILTSLLVTVLNLGVALLNADPVVTELTASGDSYNIVGVADNNNNALMIYLDGSSLQAFYTGDGGSFTELSTDAGRISLDMDASSGTAIAMWGTNPFGLGEIQTAYFSGGSWSTPSPQPLESVNQTFSTKVSMNGSGSGLGVWSTGTQIHSSFFSGGTWGTINTIGSVGSTRITASYSASGKASSLWAASNQLTASTFNGSVWSAETVLDSAITNSPSAGIDSAGNTIAVWTTGIGIDDVVSRVFNGTSWSSPVTLSTASGNFPPVIAVDEDGYSIAVWVNTSSELVIRKYRNSTWGAPAVIASDVNGSNPIAISMNVNGTAFIGWFSNDNFLMNIAVPKYINMQPPVQVSPIATVNAFDIAVSSNMIFDFWSTGGEGSDSYFSEDTFAFIDAPLGPADCYTTRSATGELLVVESSMIAEMKFAYNMNTFNVGAPTSGLGTVTFDFGLAILESLGTGSASLFSRIFAYAPAGQGVAVVFAASFFNGDEDTSERAGIGNEVDGFFFGSIDGEFGIIHRNNSVDTLIPQTSWNVDTMDGTGPSGMVLDTTLGNVYKIQYQRLEFGNINFYIELPNTGQFFLVNQIQYTNNNTVPSVTNPGMQLMAQVVSTGGDIYMEVSSMALYIEGQPDYKLGVRNSISANNSFTSTNSSFLILRNEPFLAVDNKQMVFPDELSLMVTSDSIYDAVFSLYVNVDLDGVPSFTPIPNSCTSYSTDSFPINSGTLLGTFVLALGSEAAINISDYQILIPPGTDYDLYLGCYALGLGPDTATVSASMSWLEGF